ncbi:MAG TPA: hypothetical protein VHS57_07795 [Acidimicrobiales bacterium]|nr:hypothetical protein [Acidimicrobiales bacterium]
MPSDRTTVTELGTALGMLGAGDIDAAVAGRSAVMHSLSPEMWGRLAELRAGGAYDTEFHAAWANGCAFLSADDGLRGRLPQIVEWKGTGRAPGDEVAPINLRVDHVYLVSCKYLSNILFNVSPAHVFDYLLIAGQTRGSRAARQVLPGGGDWFAEVAPAQYQELYEIVRQAVLLGERRRGGGVPAPTRAAAARGKTSSRSHATLPGLGDDDVAEPGDERPPSGGSNGRHDGGGNEAELRRLPHFAVDLTSGQRDALAEYLRAGWAPGARELYARLSDGVARASVRRWEAAMDVGGGSGEAMLWRLLRMGSAPYFVLGTAAERSLRLRIATPWDWRERYQLVSIAMEPQGGGQPRVGWEALVRDRSSNEVAEVAGHIEVRWSHGRFGGLPEAKGYLDTAHHLVPGYFPLR